MLFTRRALVAESLPLLILVFPWPALRAATRVAFTVTDEALGALRAIVAVAARNTLLAERRSWFKV